eukprot:scaffold26088_cov132-Cylindrotheca_fusiformis.AAC.3
MNPFLLLVLLLLGTASHAAVVEETHSFQANFTLETIPNGGSLSATDLTSWASTTGEFLESLYADLDLTYPIVGPGVQINVVSQEPYLVTESNPSSRSYGAKIEAKVIVKCQTEQTANHNYGFLALRMFDEDQQGNSVYFSSYLASVKAIGATFASVSRVHLDVSSSEPEFGLQDPIPTLPVANSPTMSPAGTAQTGNPGTTTSPTEILSLTPTAIPATSLPTYTPTLGKTPAPTTLSPTTFNGTRPPTAAPLPTALPTVSPSRKQFETYFTTNELSLWGADGILQGNAETQFITATSNYLTNYAKNLLGDATIQQVTVKVTSQQRGSRRLQAGNDDREHLNVEFDSVFRAASSFDAQSLANGAFGTSSRRETYRYALAATGNPVLQSITDVTLAGEQPDGSSDELSTLAIVGIAIGATILVVLIILATWCLCRKQADVGSSKTSVPPKRPMMQGPFTQAGETGTMGGGLEAEIYVDHSRDDVSTIGTPTMGTDWDGGTYADKTANNSSVRNLNFKRLLGQEPALGTTAEERSGNSETKGTTIEERSGNSDTKGETYDEDDDDLERAYNEGKQRDSHDEDDDDLERAYNEGKQRDSHDEDDDDLERAYNEGKQRDSHAGHENLERSKKERKHRDTHAKHDGNLERSNEERKRR